MALLWLIGCEGVQEKEGVSQVDTAMLSDVRPGVAECDTSSVESDVVVTAGTEVVLRFSREHGSTLFVHTPTDTFYGLVNYVTALGRPVPARFMSPEEFAKVTQFRFRPDTLVGISHIYGAPPEQPVFREEGLYWFFAGDVLGDDDYFTALDTVPVYFCPDVDRQPS